MDQDTVQLLTPPQPERGSRFRIRRTAVIAIIAVIAVIAVLVTFALVRQLQPTGRTWIAAPDGSAQASGIDVANALSLQGALDRAGPGDVILLQPGRYQPGSPLQTKRDGRARAPITLKGPESGLDISGRNKAVVTGSGHIFNVDHSYYVFDGFTINGQPKVAFEAIPDTPQELLAFKDENQAKFVDGRLIYIGNDADKVTGTVIDNMFLTGAGGECVRMRNLTSGSRVSDSLIYRCGLIAKDKDYAYHNGEGVYIGTSPNSDDQPHHLDDDSSGNVVRNNVIETFGSECVNIKEHATRNVVDSNRCRYGLGTAEANESLLEVRGKDNQVTNNLIEHSYGYGIKLWSDERSSGGGNVVAGNRLGDIRSYAITVKEQQVKAVCGNTFDGTPTFSGLDDTDPAKKCSRRYPTAAAPALNG